MGTTVAVGVDVYVGTGVAVNEWVAVSVGMGVAVGAGVAVPVPVTLLVGRAAGNGGRIADKTVEARGQRQNGQTTRAQPFRSGAWQTGPAGMSSPIPIQPARAGTQKEAVSGLEGPKKGCCGVGGTQRGCCGCYEGLGP